MYLSKQQIIAANDRVVEDVAVPEWAPAGTAPEDAAKFMVRVKSLSGRQRDAFEASMLGADRKPNLANMRARFCVQCMIDENGSQLFNANEADMLGDRNAAALDRVYQVATRLSSSGDQAVKDLAKNSSAGQPESSPSISA